jgi:hypothetical protein
MRGRPQTFIDWPSIAKRLRYKSETEMWVRLYSDRQMTIFELAGKFGVAPRVVRKALIRTGVPIRRPGGPRKRSIAFSEAQIAQIRAEGLKQAAQRLGMHRRTLEQKLHASEDYFETVRELEAKHQR